MCTWSDFIIVWAFYGKGLSIHTTVFVARVAIGADGSIATGICRAAVGKDATITGMDIAGEDVGWCWLNCLC